MNSEFLTCLGILLIFGQTSDAADPNCTFQLNVLPGKSYYIASPNYPNKYAGANSCQWNIRSSMQIHMNCEVFDVPSSNACQLDQVLVYLSSRQGPLRLCGNGTFSRDSEGLEMAITFQSAQNTPGGRFACYLQAIEPAETCRCGWRKPTRIVGGENTGVNEFPMMAGLVDANIVQVFCGAVIISNRYVLSAAHCVATKQAQELGVLIGDHDVSTGIDTKATLLRVAGYVMHPSYVINKRNSNFDIAVIAVVGSIQFTNEIGPACLPFQHNRDSFSGAVVEILGWGTTEFAGPTSNILQKAKVSVINLSKCLNTFPNLVDSQMCTLGQGKDACQFDSGGPVLWENPTTGRLVSVGIISYGIACGTKNPSVNTRVGAFVDWIVSVTPDARYCQGE